jgi:4-carboxymuconolactone decarboxylase
MTTTEGVEQPGRPGRPEQPDRRVEPERAPGPRIPPLQDPSGAAVRSLHAVDTIRADAPTLNIFATLARNPPLLDHFGRFFTYLLKEGALPGRERELVILRVGWLTGSVYEFGQHTVEGLREGLTPDEIEAIAREPVQPGHWSADDTALLSMADELCRHDGVSDGTWGALARRWSEAELLELLVLAGGYRMVCGLLNAVGIELDEGIPGWPGPTATPPT